MDERKTRTWAEINLDNIEYNYRQIRSKLKPATKYLGVVKADGYGHGAVQVASLLQELGCDYLAVATVYEAVELRRAGITLPILILGYTPPECAPLLCEYGITQAVSCTDQAQALSDYCVKHGTVLTVHIKLDSGMGRTGFTCHGGCEPEDEILKVMKLPGLSFEGVFTHFAVSDDFGNGYTDYQFEAFITTVSRLESISGTKFKIKHCTNSGAMINYYEKTQLDMVRPGVILYGCYPAAEHGCIDLKPAMELKSRVYQIKDFRDGFTVGYGRRYTASGNRRIAVIPAGYADGVHRVLSGKMELLINGHRVSQVGGICMDMMMADITDYPDISVGDTVTVFGRDGDEFIPIEALSDAAGTISYEVMCDITRRVPRVYIRNGVTLSE